MFVQTSNQTSTIQFHNVACYATVPGPRAASAKTQLNQYLAW